MRIRRAGIAAAVFHMSNVLSGAILPRTRRRKMRGRFLNARSPCTRNIKAPGSTRPRAATMARSARAWCAMPGTSAAAFALSGSITWRDDRNARWANLFAFVAGHAIENAGLRRACAHLVLVIAGVERGLTKLNERRRTGEIGQITETDDGAGGVAAHATDAIERLRRILHVLVRERLGKSAVRRVSRSSHGSKLATFFS